MATARDIARELCDEGQPVTLIYVRAQGDSAPLADDLLWRRAREVADRHDGVVELMHVDAAPAALAGPGGAAVLLVMRRGELVTEAMGPLPTSELDRLIRRALI